MGEYLLKKIREDSDWNPDTVRGLRREQQDIPGYLTNVFSSSSETFPDYIRWHRGVCVTTPTAETKTSRYQQGNVVETAKSSVHYYGIQLEYTNENGKKEIIGPRYIQIPYLDNNNNLLLSNTPYRVIPAMVDKMLAPDGAGLFVGLVRDRFTWQRVLIGIRINGTVKIIKIPYTDIYRTTKRIRHKNRTVTGLAHYLFTKFGVTETFRRYGKTDVIISHKKLNRNGWTTCGSVTRNKVYISIPDENVNTNTLKLIAGFINVTDSTYVDIDFNDLDNPVTWNIAMGQIIFGEQYHVPRRIKLVTQHIDTIESYIDPMVIMQYEKQFGQYLPKIETIWDLFGLINLNMDHWLANRDHPMFQKTWDYSYLLLYDLIKSYNLFVINIKRTALNRRVTYQEVQRLLSMNMTVGRCFKIQNQPMVVPVSSMADHPFIGANHLHVPTTGTKSTSGDIPATHPSVNLNVETLGLGTPGAVSRSKMDPFEIINPTLTVDKNDHPNRIEVLEKEIPRLKQLFRQF